MNVSARSRSPGHAGICPRFSIAPGIDPFNPLGSACGASPIADSFARPAGKRDVYAEKRK
jgi:hypothetical protein